MRERRLPLQALYRGKEARQRRKRRLATRRRAHPAGRQRGNVGCRAGVLGVRGGERHGQKRAGGGLPYRRQDRNRRQNRLQNRRQSAGRRCGVLHVLRARRRPAVYHAPDPRHAQPQHGRLRLRRQHGRADGESDYGGHSALFGRGAGIYGRGISPRRCRRAERRGTDAGRRHRAPDPRLLLLPHGRRRRYRHGPDPGGRRDYPQQRANHPVSGRRQAQ